MEAYRRQGVEGTRDAPEGAGGALANAAVAVAVVLAFCTLLGTWPLFDPDEGRNALISLEMARSGDYLLPTLAGLPFLDKPFLYFAAAAASIRWLGPDELAARLPSAVFALGIVGMVFCEARRKFGAAPARVAALACASMPLFLVFARIAILDSCLSFFVVAAILSFERCVEAHGGERPARFRAWNVAAWAAIALGVLVKGPVALLVPLLVVVPYAAWLRRSRAVWWPGGPLLLVAVLVPWLAALEHRAPGFLRYALVTETFARIATNRLHRTEPFWYFVPFVVVAAFPWSWLALSGMRGAVARSRESPETRRTLVFLALWFLVPLIFFSVVRSKRPQYLVPLLPALALMVAWQAHALREKGLGVRAAAVGWLVVGATSAFFALRANAFLTHLAAPFPTAFGFAQGLAGVAGLSGLLAWALRRSPGRAAWALAAPVLLFPWLARDVLAQVAETHSGRSLVRAIEPELDEGTEIVGIQADPLSAMFYLGRPLVLSSPDGRQLRSNSISLAYDALVGDEHGTLRHEDYWQRVLAEGADPRIFVTGRDAGPIGAVLRANGYREIDGGKYHAWVVRSRAAPSASRP